MKHPRFYTALPRVGRVRSNSASRALYTSNSLPTSFFDTPPPPNRNGPILTTHRLPIEGKGEVEAHNANPHPTHAPLALAAPHAPGAPPSAAQLALFKPYGAPGPARAPAAAHAGGATRERRRRGPRYTLDVGAYGIPKRCHRAHGGHRGLHSQATDAPLAVQVGEDAYFIRENAMGVADGVGGWARVKHLAPVPGPSSPSASALFARRLMHFCADEVDRASAAASAPIPIPIVAPWEAPRQPYSAARPARAAYAGHSAPPASWVDFAPWSEPASFAPWSESASFAPWSDAHAPDPETELAAELDELADGLDVLMILERAYERTLGAHVVPAPEDAPSSSRPSAATTPGVSVSPPSSLPWTLPLPFTKPAKEPRTIPLRAGSSTALVAVLDYVPTSTLGEYASLASTAATAVPPHHTSHPHPPPPAPATTPVLRIAHVGDCMGMLVRDGEVAWRSEEMWWRWNTPVQLSAGRAPSSSSSTSTPSPPSSTGTSSSSRRSTGGGWWGGGPASSASGSSSSASPPSASALPASSSTKPHAQEYTEVTPSSAAHVFTLPVRAGDILILASDGLSDNLWDEDVLEEVGRVGRVFGAPAAATSGAAGGEAKAEKGKEAARAGTETPVDAEVEAEAEAEADAHGLLRRRTLAGMLSEALCSRARRVATRRAGGRSCASGSSAAASAAAAPSPSTPGLSASAPSGSRLDSLREEKEQEAEEDETPFARRARETGRVYRGGKNDDISVIVAVISPADGHVEAARAAGS
ncbi:hypothetical protein B0H15DRAFT_922698 [Mycena belliarum]|uniref:Protein phosphatase n=1 Tax=Mycena belliarum TaxID=1033014 RepID=A0AAD6U6U0_9AGAR|nr:hypothetical protein B0H15DRAFT_922698 [Mycena belliae]